ncbi:MAG: glycosyltransferase 61 family protein [Promethearchaeota archaeon]
MNIKLIKVFLKLIINEIKVKRNFSIFKRKYFFYLNKKKISKKNYISNIKNYFFDSLNKIKYKIITPVYEINFTEAERNFFKEKIIGVKDSSKLKVIKEGFICIFKNVKFYGMSGGISYKNKVLIESVFDKSRFLHNIICPDSRILRYKYVEGLSTSIMHLNLAKNNLYHWIIDCLPRLYAITKYPETKINFIVNKDIDELQLEMLKIFLDDRFKIIPIDRNEVWYLEKYLFSSFISNPCSGYLPVEYLNFIKNKFIRNYGIKVNKKNKRIYISRQKALKRKLKNEKQLFDLLKKYNFERVYSEDYSFKEQVEIFSSASIIISIHGAGLTNMIFSENLKVIEIYPANFITTHYFMLAKALGFKYKYIIGDELDNKLNFRIDLSKVESLIKDLI